MPSVRGNNRRRITTRLAVTLVAASLLGPAVVANDDPSPAALKTAVKKGLDLLEKTSPTFVKKGGCNSCHNQMLPAAAQAFARGRGLDVGEPIEQVPGELSELTTERYAEYSIAGGGGVNALSFELFASDLMKQPAAARVRAQIQYIKSQQLPEGYWRGGGSLTNNGQQGLSRPGAARPPLMFDDVRPTAFMIRALTVYGPPSEAADNQARIEKAQQWLAATQATRLQEHAFRVLGLKWANADRRTLDAAV